MEKSQIEDTTSTAKPDELLQRFLRALVSNRVPMTKAIGVAAKILKEHKTPSAIGRLTDIQLIAAGINEEGLRRLILAAIRKGGFNPHSKSTKNDAQGTSNSEGPLASTSRSAQTDISPRKRKRTSDTNEFLPDRPEGEEVLDSLEFDEILDEEVLKNKNIFINRAPIMAVWAMVVLERQGFKREEALSIALAFTQMNAIYGGVSANIFPKGKEKEFERSLTSSQPYVDLMGRNPLCRVASQWRAILTEGPIRPTQAYSYIKKKLMYNTPRVVGALRLLANSFTPTELNEKGHALYLEFRPDAQWGKNGRVDYDTILGLRKAEAHREHPLEDVKPPIQQEALPGPADGQDNGPEHKRARGMTLEEYEEILDADDTFNGVDPDALAAPH